MPQVSIREVRQEIMRAAGHAQPEAAASAAVVGTLFHAVLRDLMAPQGWQAALEPEDLEDIDRLVSHTYESLLGPRLTEMQAGLSEYGAETLHLWQATKAMCGWLCRLLKAAEERGLIRYDAEVRGWAGAGSLCQPELPLQWEVREPGWTAPVLVSGIADALWRDPRGERWCVVEYKLGKGSPEADLAQACLYHAVLAASGLGPADGALALLSFRPELEERFYSTAELAPVQARIRALIGRMAGVVPDAQPRSAAIAPEPQPAMPNPEHAEFGRRLVRALKDYGVDVRWDGEVIAGPTFLRYPVIPGRDVRKRAITDRAEELQMQLRLEQAPFIDLAKGRLVIDVQRPDRQVVDFARIAAQIGPEEERGTSRAPLGVDLSGKLEFVDLASSNNPHLLVAGTSGSGKTEWLRMAIAGMMLANTPRTLRLVLIDPKRNAFPELRGSPYLFGEKGLLHPPEDRVGEALELLIEEMEARYRRFSPTMTNDLDEYRRKTGEVVPRIVCVCDEYADLLTDRQARKEVESAINRLGAKARAAGIHLIIATQHPDRNTVGGALKMNLAGRVCLRTTSHTQSNMIINRSGAEWLLGRGDLFFLSIGEPVRLQAPYLSEEERARIFGQGERLRTAGSG